MRPSKSPGKNRRPRNSEEAIQRNLLSLTGVECFQRGVGKSLNILQPGSILYGEYEKISLFV
jgi:hypothetical protein